jgi:hypothetical protein
MSRRLALPVAMEWDRDALARHRAVFALYLLGRVREQGEGARPCPHPDESQVEMQTLKRNYLIGRWKRGPTGDASATGATSAWETQAPTRGKRRYQEGGERT